MTHRTDYQLKEILKYNRDGSQSVKQTRHQNLMRFITHLQKNRGYANHWNLHKLGKKEVHRYVSDLKERGLVHRTIENNLKDIRWLATKLNRDNLIPSNRDCGLKKREYSIENKAVRLSNSHLALMDDRMKLINRLKAEFGLREKEALKFGYQYATSEEGRIKLKDTWCKNGRSRSIDIVNIKQIELLKEVEQFQKAKGDYSMIPHDIKYKTYRNYVQEKSNDLGIKGHSFRHQWAQDRFKELSGFDSPIAGGVSYASLNLQQQEIWDRAAGVVNQELGHGKGRLDTTATYIGVR